MKWPVLVLAFVSTSSLGAQSSAWTTRTEAKPARAAAPASDPFTRCLVPPELVMAHQRDIELQDAQRAKLIAEMSQAQTKFTEVQWTMSAEGQKLEQILKAATIDEAAAVKQLDRILSLEQDLKRTQLTLLLRVKNTLTQKQRDMLHSLRSGQDPWMRVSDGSAKESCGS